jgi:exonuclease VII small subunit
LNLAQSNTAEDSHVIARLYEQLLDLDGFFVSSPSNLLTSIVQRLSTCANLHSKAMSFENRLDGLERIVKDLTPTVQNLEDCISRVESGMINNMKVLEQNMNALDDQVKAIR